MHGVESDWVEEEMMEDDVDFIRDVLEQKVIKALNKAGIIKKVERIKKHFEFSFCVQILFLDTFRWEGGPLHRSMKPVVIVFKHM